MDISRLKKKVFLYSGMNTIRRNTHRKPRVLFWHGIDSKLEPDICPEVFSVTLFIKQIKYLKHYFDIISIHDFEKRIKQDSFNGREVLLTFDDGYANNLYIVEPILSALNLPFTVFISTDNITTGDYYPTSINRLVTFSSEIDKLEIPSLDIVFLLKSKTDRRAAAAYISRQLKSKSLHDVKDIVSDLIHNLPSKKWETIKDKFSSLRPMNWNEVQLLSKKKNVTIGSHCKWHICCHDKQPQEIVRNQIKDSKIIIENQLQLPCDFFAYPNGDYTEFSNICVESTYKLGFSAETRTSLNLENKCVLPRISGYVNQDLFKILMSS